MGQVQKHWLSTNVNACHGSNVSQVWLLRHSVYTWFSLQNPQGLWKHFLEPTPNSHNDGLVNTNWKSTIYFKCILGRPPARCLFRLHATSSSCCSTHPRHLLPHCALWIPWQPLSPALDFLSPKHRRTKSIRDAQARRAVRTSEVHIMIPLSGSMIQLVQWGRGYLAF